MKRTVCWRKFRYFLCSAVLVGTSQAVWPDAPAGWEWTFSRPLTADHIDVTNLAWSLNVEGNTTLELTNGTVGFITFTNISVDLDLYPTLRLETPSAEGGWTLSAALHGGVFTNLHSALEPGTAVIDLADHPGWSGQQQLDLRITCSNEVELRRLSLEIKPGWTLVDSFDSHHWVGETNAVYHGLNPHIPNNGGWMHPFDAKYSSAHNVEGESALRVTTPIVTDGDANFIYFKTTLPEPEDWTSHKFLTFDGYLEEAPLVMPSGGLVLKNENGEEARVNLILGWQFFEWENRQTTFPLQGNMMKGVFGTVTNWEIYPVPTEILSNVVEVTLGFEYYSDPEIETNYVHLDNMRLSSVQMWDRFEGPDYGWHSYGTNARVGISANRTHERSAGSLCIRWDSNPSERITARTKTNASWNCNWNAFSCLGLNVWAAQPDTACRLVINGTRTTTVSAALSTEEWTPLVWDMPIGITVVSNVAIEVVCTAQIGRVYADDLRIGSFSNRIEDLTSWALKNGNRLEWSISDTNALSISIRVDTNTLPTSHTDGTDVTNFTIEGETHFSVDHLDVESGATYYYGVFVEYAPGSFTPLSGDGAVKVSRDLLIIDGGAYEAAFSKINGALLYIHDNNTDRTISYGNEHMSLWHTVFMGETVPALESSWFSPHEQTLQFSYTESPLVLNYDYINGTQSLALAVSVDTWSTNRLVFRLGLTNNTSQAIRTVGAPRHVLFSVTNINNVVFPVQEGVRLTREYFAAGRYMFEPRPWLFADYIGIDSTDGLLSFIGVQDSDYEADLFPSHDPALPMFQPSVMGIGASMDTPGMAIMDYEMITYIPKGSGWSSPTLVLESGGDSLRDSIEHYKQLNQLDDTNLFPTLEQKLEAFGLFDEIARSAVLVVECELSVDWLKAPQGELWSTIENEWLDVLPRSNVLHFTHWQTGTLEENHPDCQPINVVKYGSSNDLSQMLATIRDRDEWWVMPFCDWLVWNKPADMVYSNDVLVKRPEACAKVRDPYALYLDYHGYMTKPWHTNVITVNSNMMQYYTTEVPVDLMFIDMTCERSWRYTRIDTDGDDVDERIVTGYTQGLVDHNNYLKQFKPLYTEGIFDRMMGEISGYCGTLRQKRLLDWLAHMGDEFEDWAIYPLAADVAHEHVGFYQHDLNTPIFPTNKFLLTHYTTMGYNYLVDVAMWYNENNAAGENWMYICDAYQKAVAAKSFGRPLQDYIPAAGGDQRIITTSYNTGTNEITIVANYHHDTSFTTNGYGIAADGFLATIPDHRVIAGIFTNSFNGSPLSDGDHFITVERVAGNEILVKQPHGKDTRLVIPRPSAWTNNVFAISVLKDGSEVMAPGNLLLSQSELDLNYTKFTEAGDEVAEYRLLSATGDELPLLFLSSPVLETQNATQTWVFVKGNRPVSLVVYYGIEGGAEYAVTNENLSLTHAQLINLPDAGTDYWFRVELIDESLNSVLSGTSPYPAGGLQWEEQFSEQLVHIQFDLSSAADKDIVYDAGDAANDTLGGHPTNTLCFVEDGWFDGSLTASGLPVNLTVTSTEDPVGSYHLLPYDGLNVIELASTNGAAVESHFIQAPVTARYHKIGILGAACNGDAAFTVKLHYDDDTITTNVWRMDDWFDTAGSTNTRTVLTNLQAVTASSGTILPGSDIKLYEFIIETNNFLDGSKMLEGITLANDPTREPADSDTYTAIFAVTGLEKTSGWRDKGVETGGWFFATLETDDGMGVVTVDDAPWMGSHYGKVLSEIMTVDLSKFPILEVAIPKIDIYGSNTYYQIALQDQDAAPYPKVVLYKDTNPRQGTMILNIPKLTGWSGQRKFAIEFGIFNHEMRKQVMWIDYVKLRKDATEAWVEDCEPLRDSWIDEDVSPGVQARFTDNGNGTASLVQDGGAGWGSVYSDRLVFDIADYPWFVADVPAVKDPVQNASFKVNQNDELSSAINTVIPQKTEGFHASGPLEHFGTNALDEMRLSLIIGGYGQTAVVERLSIAKRADDQNALQWNGDPATLKVGEDQAIWLPVLATDYEGLPVQYTSIGLPGDAVYDGILTWTPDSPDVGTHWLTLIAENGVTAITNITTITVTNSTIQLQAPLWSDQLIVTDEADISLLGSFSEELDELVVQVSVDGQPYSTDDVVMVDGLFSWQGPLNDSPITFDARLLNTSTLARSSSNRCIVYSSGIGPGFLSNPSIQMRDATSLWVLVRADTQVTASVRFGNGRVFEGSASDTNMSMTHALLVTTLPPEGFWVQAFITNAGGQAMISASFFCPGNGVDWDEHFTTHPSGWILSQDVSLVATTGVGRITYTNDFWGKAESPSITADLSVYPVLDISVPDAEVWPGEYRIGLQEQEGDWEFVTLFSAENAGRFILSIPKLTGWQGVKTFSVEFAILSGSSPDEKFVNVDHLLVRADSDSAWLDDFAPPHESWDDETYYAYLNDNGDGTASLHPTGGSSWGQVRSEMIVLDFDEYPWLTVEGIALTNGAHFIMNKFDMPTSGTVQQYDTWVAPFADTSSLVKVDATNLLDQFKIVFAIEGGVNATCVLDRLEIRKTAAGRTLLWDPQPADLTLSGYSSVELPFTGMDFAGHPVDYTWVSLPEGATYDGIFRWQTPPRPGTTSAVLVAYTDTMAVTNVVTFEIEPIEFSAEGYLGPTVDDCDISWESVSGETYRVLYNHSLFETNWFTLGSDIAATGNIARVTDDSMGTNVLRYYRIIQVWE